MRCALCGRYFSEEEAIPGCRSCPMHRRCGRWRCPYCGYEWVKTPQKNRPSDDSLAALAPGDRAVIAKIETIDGRLLRKLMALGLIPGNEVHVLRNYPGLVLRLGRAELAVDRETATTIKVRTLPLPQDGTA